MAPLAGALGVALFVACLPLFRYYRVRASYVVFSLLVMGAPLASGRLESMNRYVLTAFPVFLVLGALVVRYPLLQPVLTMTFVMLLSLSAVRFASYYWVG